MTHPYRLLLPALLPLCALAGLALPPVAASSDSTSRGAELFANSGCSHCHGPAGLGGGNGQGPNLKDVKKRLKPDAISTQIHDGGKSMPAFGDQFTQQQIADLVDYLRSKRKAPKP